MNQQLLARARGLLAQSSVLAEAPGVSFVPRGSHAHESKDPTTGKGGDVFSYFAVRLSGCQSDHDLEGFCEALQSELDGIRKRPPSPKVKTKMELLYGCWSGDYFKAAAKASGVSESSVLRWRGEVGLDPYYGDRDKKVA